MTREKVLADIVEFTKCLAIDLLTTADSFFEFPSYSPRTETSEVWFAREAERCLAAILEHRFEVEIIGTDTVPHQDILLFDFTMDCVPFGPYVLSRNRTFDGPDVSRFCDFVSASVRPWIRKTQTSESLESMRDRYLREESEREAAAEALVSIYGPRGSRKHARGAKASGKKQKN